MHLIQFPLSYVASATNLGHKLSHSMSLVIIILSKVLQPLAILGNPKRMSFAISIKPHVCHSFLLHKHSQSMVILAFSLAVEHFPWPINSHN
jgi:hypothetical protein